RCATTRKTSFAVSASECEASAANADEPVTIAAPVLASATPIPAARAVNTVRVLSFAPCPRSSRGGRPLVSGDEPLTSVDVIGRAGDGGVDHEVNGEGGEVGWLDHPPDRQGCAQLLTPGLDVLRVLEVRRRERGVDEAGLDEVDAHRSELQRERL